MKREQLAINSISTSGAFEERLDAYAAAGFHNVEFYLGHVKEYLNAGHSAADVHALLDARGQQCVGGFEGGVEILGDEEARRNNHASVVDNARLLGELGGQVLVVGIGGGNLLELDDAAGHIASIFGRLAKQIEDTGVQLAIEFNWGPVKSLPLATEIARRSGAANVGVLFDPAHYHCTSTKFEDLTPENVAFIKHVHVNNMRRKAAELSNCNDDRLLPDDPAGTLDVKGLLTKIEANGYKGLFSIEMFSQELWDLPPAAASKRMFSSLQFLL